jgi:hypothetical protein
VWCGVMSDKDGKSNCRNEEVEFEARRMVEKTIGLLWNWGRKGRAWQAR